MIIKVEKHKIYKKTFYNEKRLKKDKRKEIKKKKLI